MRPIERHLCRTALFLLPLVVSRDARCEELAECARASAASARSIDPSDTNFSDLEGLAGSLRDVDVVLLGEALHSDGATDLGRARLTRFLHERLGFDVIAMETSLFYAERMEDELNSKRGTGATAMKLLADDFARMRELAPIFDYLKTTRSTAHVMHAAGIDPQLNRAPDEFYAWVIATIDRSKLLDAGSRGRIATTLARYPKSGKFRPMTAQQREEDRHAWQKLVDRTHVHTGKGQLSVSEIARLERCAEQMLVLYDWHADVRAEDNAVVDWVQHAAANNVRDRAMADNVRWLRDTRYPGAKVVVWAANFHIMRTAQGLERPQFAGVHPMGEWLSAAPRVKTWSVAFTAAEGQSGWPGEVASAIPPPAKGSLEQLLSELHMPFVYARTDALPEKSVSANVLGYTPITGLWKHVFDGIFMIRSMTPTHSVDSEK